jgi:carbonic anhydrase
MSVTDEILAANERFAHSFSLKDLAMPPKRHLAVLACMDARLAVDRVLGLEPGDAHVIRNAGGIATDDAVRSLIISHYLLGTREFVIINHTDCGMLTFQDDELRRRLEQETGKSAVAPEVFHSFTDLDANVATQIRRLRSHPWIPASVGVRGFVYDVATGKLREVAEAKKRHA